jgi:hypothetical protein
LGAGYLLGYTSRVDYRYRWVTRVSRTHALRCYSTLYDDAICQVVLQAHERMRSRLKRGGLDLSRQVTSHCVSSQQRHLRTVLSSLPHHTYVPTVPPYGAACDPASRGASPPNSPPLPSSAHLTRANVSDVIRSHTRTGVNSDSLFARGGARVPTNVGDGPPAHATPSSSRASSQPASRSALRTS